MLTNPFSIVKATEYSDAQILESWVPLLDTDESSTDEYYDKLRPNELMPKYILGSKGCGKTHLLRYYSLEARRQKHHNDIRELLEQDRYISVYSKLDGLSSSRFCNHCTEDNLERWIATYDYYFELYQSILALSALNKIAIELNTPEKLIIEIEQWICKSVNLECEILNSDSLLNFLNEQRRTIDKAIRQFAHTRELDYKSVLALFDFGSLMFEIPYAFSKFIKELKDVNFIYILDEYEKLQAEWQKESLNTLVFEKKHNVTFWVGARKTGYTTRVTKMKEIIHDGHEYEPVDLDVLLKRNEKAFNLFARKVFVRRLELAHLPVPQDANLFFEEFDVDKLNKKLLEKAELRHWKRLSEHLVQLHLDEEKIQEIISGLKYKVEKDPLGQKGKIFRFYQIWSKSKKKLEARDFIQWVESVNDEYNKYIQGNNKTYKERVEKFKQDFLAQLSVENNINYYQYSGFDELVKVSDCNPRVFLTLMKLIVDDSFFRGVDPFTIEHKKISIRSQYVGINDTARWFLNDIEVYGAEREILNVAINNLVQWFFDNRYCDKPTETSLCAFYFRDGQGLEKCKQVIDMAVNEAFLIRDDSERKDKSLKTPQPTYQLNRLVASLYNLPIARRGIISFSKDVLLSIFDVNSQTQFRTKENSLKKELNAPFGFIIRSQNQADIIQQPTLFDNQQ